MKSNGINKLKNGSDRQIDMFDTHVEWLIARLIVGYSLRLMETEDGGQATK